MLYIRNRYKYHFHEFHFDVEVTDESKLDKIPNMRLHSDSSWNHRPFISPEWYNYYSIAKLN